MSLAQELVDGLEGIQTYRDTHRLEYYKPYPFQYAFHCGRAGQLYTSDHYEVSDGPLAEETGLVCANQIGKCNSISTYIETSTGRKKLKDIWGKDVKVLTYPDKEPRQVLKWVRKPAEECFRVTMSDGQWFECPRHHRILTTVGYVFLDDILKSRQPSVAGQSDQPLLRGLFSSVQDFLQDGRKGVRRWTGTIRGLINRYLVDPRLCGGQLLYDQEGVQVFAPSTDGVQPHISRLYNVGVLAYKYIYSLCESLFRLSNLGAYYQIWGQSDLSSGQKAAYSFLQFRGNSQELKLSYDSGCHQAPSVSVFQNQCQSFSLHAPTLNGNRIISINSVGVHTLYDMEVEERHNYIAGGMVHHNTLSAAMETAIHATGLYPDWWDGIKFEKEVTILCCGKRNETVRDVIQNELIGDPFDESSFGTGTIPIDKLGKTFRKAGVPNALTAVMVKHRNGKWSKVRFMAFEQGPDAFMGVRYDAAWADEEPPSDIMSQLKRSQLTKKHKKIYSTFTPEEGFTEVVDQLLNNQAGYQSVVTATWDDAPHMTPERQEIELQKFPPHERPMRSQGKPLMGSGLVFNTPDDRITVDRFSIPEWWPRISAVDFGQDHPFAWCNLALDPDRDILYVTDTYRESKALISTQVSTINHKSEKWIPITWPHDGLQTDAKSGVPLADLYREEGLNLTEDRFTNPPSDFQKEGQGGNGVEVGLFEMQERMETERFKVFADLDDWFQEKRQYHRKNVNGKYVIVKLRDDLMSATRYATMSLRHAQTRPVSRRQVKVSRGATNW